MKRSSTTSEYSLKKSLKKAEFNVNDPDVDYWGITHIKVAKFTYKWIIQNYYFCCLENDKFIESLPFSTEAYNRLKFYLRLHPNDEHNTADGFAALYIRLEAISNSYLPIKVRYQFSIIDKFGIEVHARKSLETFEEHNRLYGFKNYIKQDILNKEVNDLLNDGCLTILCQMCISVNDTTILTEANATQLKITKCSLSNDFSALFENNDFSDITLIVSGELFNVHKVILASRSVVFSNMFKSDAKEISISDVKPAIMKEILRYIYTDNVQNLYTMAKEIIPGANKYALPGLITMCEKALAESFTVGNVIEILILADQNNLTYLKKEAILFFNLHSKDLLDKPEFKSLETSHPTLTIEIFRTMIKKQKL